MRRLIALSLAALVFGACQDSTTITDPQPLEAHRLHAWDGVTLIVNTNDDLFDGACDAVHCSLRDAIEVANATAGRDRIVFDVPGPGPHTIQPGEGGLPEILDPVIIDGTTEPDFEGTPIIELDGSNAGDVSGLYISGGNTVVRGLVINRFGSEEQCCNGIDLMQSSGNVIQGNYIGTDVTGTEALGNTNAGVTIGGPNNLIGGKKASARNVISGNLEGVTFADLEARNNLVLGNYIGTDASGTAAVGNVVGILLLGNANTIGGTEKGTRNIISGNENGVNIHTTGNVLQGNYIGTDVTGTVAIGNQTGVFLSGPGNLIGGALPASRNVISGNEGVGVDIKGGDASGNRVVANFIGVDFRGSEPLGNGLQGVFIGDGAVGNTISHNILSANGDGVLIFGRSNNNNRVWWNRIGTDMTGTLDLGNMKSGVYIILASDNSVLRNTIAFNGQLGVGSPVGTGNAVLFNSIFENGDGLGIELGTDGATPNDLGDEDTGPNNLQNFPELTAASGWWLRIEGTLNSTPQTDFRLQFFANGECDPSGYGEGQTYVDTRWVHTDANGDASFSFRSWRRVAPGSFITATATDPNGNTSEFSACIERT